MKRGNPFSGKKKKAIRSIFSKSSKVTQDLSDEEPSSSSSENEELENSLKRPKTSHHLSGAKKYSEIPVSSSSSALVSNPSSTLRTKGELESRLSLPNESGQEPPDGSNFEGSLDKTNSSSIEKESRKRPGKDHALSILQSLTEGDQGESFDKDKGGVGGGPTQRLSTVRVLNINPKMTEERVEEHFKPCGKIHLVKIIWPRTEEEKAANSNRGYITFYNRESSYDAINMFNNTMWENHLLKIIWAEDQSKVSVTDFHNFGNTSMTSNSKTSTTFEPNIIKIHPAVSLSMDGIPIDSNEDNSSTKRQINNMKDENESEEKPNQENGKEDRTRNDNLVVEDGYSNEGPRVESISRLSTNANEEQIIVINSSKNRRYQPMSHFPPIYVTFPERIQQLYLINRVAKYVAKDGSAFEKRLMTKEKHNPDYNFLRDHSSPEGLFYRWKVYSILIEKKENSWNETPFQITVGGPFWHPPKLLKGLSLLMEQEILEEATLEKTKNPMEETATPSDDLLATRTKNTRDGVPEDEIRTGRELEIEREKRRGGGKASYLAREDYILLINNLRKLTFSRTKIKECMVIAFDNKEAWEDVVLTIKKYVIDRKHFLSLATRLAILYLIHDILWNANMLSFSSFKNASLYKDHFQKHLPEIVESLNTTIYHAEYGRLTLRNIEDKVLLLLRFWKNWSFFSEIFLDGLEATFLQTPQDLEWDKIDDIDESKLDYYQLYRKAKNAGLVVEVDNKKCDATDLLRKLNYLNNFINRRKRKNTISVNVFSKDNKIQNREKTRREARQDLSDVQQLHGPHTNEENKAQAKEEEEEDIDGFALDGKLED